MTRDEAERIAIEFLKTKSLASGYDLVLVGSCTMERSFGWVFFYDSRRHIETGEISHALAGNAPFVVMREDGRIHETGTALPIEHYLAAFEK